MVLRISEIYPSYQGEGPNTGKPTTFVRFAGCNLKCPGWPCDTPHAIDPKIFTKEQKIYKDPTELARDVLACGTNNICLTGGEVFIQPSDELECLLEELRQELHTAHGTVEVFTNGTRPISRGMRAMLDSIILDWKLPGSGESTALPHAQLRELYPDNATDMRNVLINLRGLGPRDAVKFTIKDRADYDEAKYRWTHILRHQPNGGVVFCGPVWDGIDITELTKWMLADGLPWRLNVQLHKYIWHPNARRT
jgi:7-carboxy-7-deazaguanine synthase